jgi:hypothetical protein
MEKVENFSAFTNMVTISTSSPVENKTAATLPQLYQQEMESIREKVEKLPDDQNKVVMHQLWTFGHTSFAPNPEDFPALATYGFIVEQPMDDRKVWQPCASHLKDFARIGISPSNNYGYTLKPFHVFQADLRAKLRMLSAV